MNSHANGLGCWNAKVLRIWSGRQLDQPTGTQRMLRMMPGSIVLWGLRGAAVLLLTTAFTWSSHSLAAPTIIRTSYAIPPGAYFVAPNGNDNDVGSETAPWRTIRKAVDSSPSGSTIVIRQGVYRESVVLANKKLTLQPYPGEEVWMKGSIVVTDWVADGGIWREDDWPYQFRHIEGPSDSIDPQYPLAGYPDMVFVDGQPLEQVASKAEVTGDKFYVDYTRQQLYIGTDPTGKTVEAAARVYALSMSNAPGTVIRGLGFMHYAPSIDLDQQAMVRGTSNRLTFENNTFAWSAAAGLTIQADSVVRGNSFVYNGQLGLGGYRAFGLVMEHNYFAYNNQKRFNASWEAGGVKIAAGRDMVWRDNVAEYNIGAGLWCDVSCYNTTIVGNTVRGNEHNGINYETSAQGIIASNVVVNNGGVGILVLESSEVDIYNNTLSRNNGNVRVLEGERRRPNDPIISYDVRNVVIRNNILSNVGADGSWLLGVDDSTGRRSAAAMNVSADYNGYYRSSSDTPSLLALWARWPGDPLLAQTLPDFNLVGQERHSLSIGDTPSNPFFTDEANGNYRLKSGSPALGAGSPLPGYIARELGVQEGVAVNLGAFLPESTSPGSTSTTSPAATPTLGPPGPTPTTLPSDGFPGYMKFLPQLQF